MKGPPRSRRLRLRTLLLFLLLLVAGAAVNVAVAWGIAAYGPVWPLDGSSKPWRTTVTDAWTKENDNWWRSSCPFPATSLPVQPVPVKRESDNTDDYGRGCGGVVSDYMNEFSSAGFDVLQASSSTLHDNAYVVASVVRMRSGVPMRALSASHWHQGNWSNGSGQSEAFCGGLRVNVTRNSENWDELSFLIDNRFLPLLPIWPGFVINTVFYAAILWVCWLLFAAPFAVRRRRRIKRGLCPACAYPVGASEVCTECGKPVSRMTPP